MEQTFMKEKKILPLVLSMSMPMVLSMLVNALYNIVDSYFVAKISDEAMTALSLVYPLQLLETAVAVGFGVGINAIAAFYLGAKNDRKANDSVSVGLVLSFVHGILLMAFNLLFAPTFLRMFSKDNLVIEYGLTYSCVVFAFMVPYTIAITYEKIFQAEGQMKVSMFSMICGCVANVILDPLMIFGIGPFPRMGIAGAALATGIGQIIPLVVYLLLYFKLKLPLKVQFRKEMFDKELCLHIYGVGVPATLNMALPSFMITALNGILSTYGDVYVLVLGIYYKLQTFIYLTANGMVQGIRPIIGYNYGAGEYGRVKKTFFTSLRLIAGIMLAGMIICLVFCGQLMGIFTTGAETIAAGKTAIRIISMGFVVSSVSVTVSGTLEGLGKGSMSLAISLLRYLVAIIPAAYVFGKLLGADGIWNCFWFAETAAAVVAWILYKKEEQKMK